MYMINYSLDFFDHVGGGNNGVPASFHFPVRKSITAPPRGPPWDCRHMYLSVMPAVPKLLWARPVCCRISPPRLLAESRKRQLNQGSFVFAVYLVVYFH